MARFWETFNEAVEWFVKMTITNIYWFILNLPFAFVIFTMIFSPVKIGLLYYLLCFFILVPLLFFPGTTALFAVARDWVLKRETASHATVFFKYFKDNYKKSVISGLIFMFLWLIIVGDVYYLQSVGNAVFSMIFLIFGAGLLVYTIQFISLSVHFEMDVKTLLKNAFYFTFGKPIYSLLIFFITTFLIYVSIAKLWFLLPFFTGSIIAYLSFFIFYRMYLRIKHE